MKGVMAGLFCRLAAEIERRRNAARDADSGGDRLNWHVRKNVEAELDEVLRFAKGLVEAALKAT